MQAQITDHLVSKIRFGIYSDLLKYDLSQEEGDESDYITIKQYLSNMTAKIGNYASD